MKWESKKACNKCTKKFIKRTVLVKLNVEDVVTCFLEHSVVLL